MNASQLMTRDPASVRPATTIAEVWDLMREMDIRHVPIVEHGVIGMVNDRELAGLDVAAILARRGAEALREALAVPVVRVMCTDVTAIDTNTSLSDAIDLFVARKIGAVPGCGRARASSQAS